MLTLCCLEKLHKNLMQSKIVLVTNMCAFSLTRNLHMFDTQKSLAVHCECKYQANNGLNLVKIPQIQFGPIKTPREALLEEIESRRNPPLNHDELLKQCGAIIDQENLPPKGIVKSKVDK